MAQDSPAAVVMDRGQLRHVPVTVPYEHRGALRACSWGRVVE